MIRIAVHRGQHNAHSLVTTQFAACPLLLLLLQSYMRIMILVLDFASLHVIFTYYTHLIKSTITSAESTAICTASQQPRPPPVYDCQNYYYNYYSLLLSSFWSSVRFFIKHQRREHGDAPGLVVGVANGRNSTHLLFYYSYIRIHMVLSITTSRAYEQQQYQRKNHGAAHGLVVGVANGQNSTHLSFSYLCVRIHMLLSSTTSSALQQQWYQCREHGDVQTTSSVYEQQYYQRIEHGDAGLLVVRSRGGRIPPPRG